MGRREPPEAHNASVDEDLLDAGACARLHLATGRVCTLRHGHPGSCEFVPPAQAYASLARHQGLEGWVRRTVRGPMASSIGS